MTAIATLLEDPAPVGPPAPRLPAERPAARVGALDGLRAVAVAAVIVYHLSPRVLPGGFLGVDVFMVVSGYLITGLLAGERARTGRIRLLRFWGRRFRRLVPALALLVTVTALWVRVDGPRALAPSVRAQGFAALGYVSNWKLVRDGVTYGGISAAGAPFVHLWSLAVEEQFYVVWPLVVAATLLLARRALLGVVVVGAAASALAMAAWYTPGRDPIRLYYGTDTRAQAFLIGGLAAVAAPRLGARGRRAVVWLGAAALAAVLLAMRTDNPRVLYRGGFALVASGAALVVVATTTPGLVTSLLDRAPLRALGRVSYGAYLWHWPVITLLTADRTGLRGVALLALRLAVTAAGTTLSWFALERPVQRASPRRVALVGTAGILVAALALATLPSRDVVAYARARTDRLPRAVSVSEPAVGWGPARGTAMIVGDSGMYDATPALRAGLAGNGYRVVEAAFPGAGITRPDGVRAWLTTQTRRYRVDLTIVMIGRWDLQWVAERGEAAYRVLLEETVAGLESAGGRVVWLSGLPGEVRGVTPLDPLFEGLARDDPAVEFVDISPALRAADGSYPRVVDGTLVRKPDGWHLCPDGAARVATAVLRDLRLGDASWLDGDWRADVRYDDPPGGCR